MNNLKAPSALLTAQKLANLADTKWKVPFLGIPLGLDFLIGLIPVVGDFIMLCVALYIVLLAKKMKVPSGLRSIMLRNVFIDFVLGFIPVVGDLADLFFKANQKNVRLMEQWWVTQHHQDIKNKSKAALKEWESHLD